VEINKAILALKISAFMPVGKSLHLGFKKWQIKLPNAITPETKLVLSLPLTTCRADSEVLLCFLSQHHFEHLKVRFPQI
jgi:hypothetical protein